MRRTTCATAISRRAFRAIITRIYDQSKVISYYDDVAATFTNFAMSGIDKVHFGLEAAVSIPIYTPLALNAP